MTDIEIISKINFIGQLVSSNLLPEHILISLTVFKKQTFEICGKKIPTPTFGEILPQLRCPRETLDPQLKQIF